MSDYRTGYRDGYKDALHDARRDLGKDFDSRPRKFALDLGEKPKRKRPQSKKQKLLKTMTDKKWRSYKGKKTWVQIRAQVSRSQVYKKKARRLYCRVAALVRS